MGRNSNVTRGHGSESPPDLSAICISNDDKENLMVDDEYETDADSYLFKSRLRPSTTGISGQKNTVKSFSANIHVALDAAKRDVAKRQLEMVQEAVVEENKILAERELMDEKKAALQKTLKAVRRLRPRKVIKKKAPKKITRRMSMKGGASTSSPLRYLGNDSFGRDERRPLMPIDFTAHLEDDKNEVEEQKPQIPFKLPVCKDYDPAKQLPSHRTSLDFTNFDDEMNISFFQKDIPENDYKVAKLDLMKEHVFYLFQIVGEARERLTAKIEALGGRVVSRLDKATRIVFNPSSEQLKDKDIFFLATAAAAGKYFLAVKYLEDSHAAKKFLTAGKYATVDHFENKHNIHYTLKACIKMSVKFRDIFTDDDLEPIFFRESILLAAPENECEDVKLLLQVCGAFVQPLHNHDQHLSNPLVHMIITSGKVQLDKTCNRIPQATTEEVREMLWRTFKKYLD